MIYFKSSYDSMNCLFAKELKGKQRLAIYVYVCWLGCLPFPAYNTDGLIKNYDAFLSSSLFFFKSETSGPRIRKS
jgi:hypothetical protein